VEGWISALASCFFRWAADAMVGTPVPYVAPEARFVPLNDWLLLDWPVDAMGVNLQAPCSRHDDGLRIGHSVDFVGRATAIYWITPHL
jgi:hypothetical protein